MNPNQNAKPSEPPESQKLRDERLARIRQMRLEMAIQFREKFVLFMSTALGVVAALFWQTAITDTLKAFIPVGGTWIYELVVAVLVTVLAVLALSIMHQQTAPPITKI